MADLLDRRMMSLYGVESKPATKLSVQNTSKKLQAAQHITMAGQRSPSMRELSQTIDVDTKLSVTIGLDAQGETYTTSVGDPKDNTGIPNNRATITKEYQKARDTL